VVLTAKKAGQATLSFKNGQVLKNDGLGTAATLAINPLAVTVVAESKKITATTAADQEPPEAFAAQINHDNNFFDGLSFVTFLAQDKISGIDHYEFTTSTNRRIGESAVWQTTNSPLLLNKKSPHYFIYIKAVDRAGNVRIVRAPANLPLWWYEKILVWKDSTLEQAKVHLKEIHNKLENLDEKDWNYDSIKNAVWDYTEKEGRGAVLWPFRVALSGREKSPDPFELASILGKETTLRRLR
jgi:hypothetical protein